MRLSYATLFALSEMNVDAAKEAKNEWHELLMSYSFKHVRPHAYWNNKTDEIDVALVWQ